MTAMTSAPGAYALGIRLRRKITFESGRIAGHRLAPGFYVYCGSANGPGGLAARVGRHLKRRKALRWHVDQLTTAGDIVKLWLQPGGSECGLVARVLARPGSDVPVPGFGSTDCRTCRSHLLTAPPELVLPDLELPLSGAALTVFDVADLGPLQS
jgi:Uri superfamily endonuclease